MIPVAASHHPLVAEREQVSEIELKGFRQVVLRDTGTRREQDAGWLQADQRWTVSHFSSSIRIVKSGLAFAILPSNWIRAELAAGELLRIPLEQSIDRCVPLYLMLADQQAAEPATRALADIVAAALAESG